MDVARRLAPGCAVLRIDIVAVVPVIGRDAIARLADSSPEMVVLIGFGGTGHIGLDQPVVRFLGEGGVGAAAACRRRPGDAGSFALLRQVAVGIVDEGLGEGPVGLPLLSSTSWLAASKTAY